MKKILAVIFLAITFSLPASASPWWVFFSDESGRKPGDAVSVSLIERVSQTGANIRTVSRYFNAVSVDYNGIPETLKKIPGVREVSPVHSLVRSPDPEKGESFSAKRATALADSITRYGVTYNELKMLNVPSVHERGYTGKGVIIGIVDTGFDKIKETGCLKNVNIIKTRNFISGGEYVSGDSHGSYVLSCLAGAADGEFYGPAYEASFLLAVTDDALTETHADEDRWVAGVEWCDSLGAKIISSSLVYNEFDNPADNYQKQDMNGLTSIVARAAEIAVRRGMVVVNSAGNEGMNAWGIITTPGDAEHVITVGAVTVVKDGNPIIAGFSSRGPTADGRIKPDVVAPGKDVYVPILGSNGSYTLISGTSLAAPFISGLCALLLEAHPSWTPALVMAALKASSRDLGDSGPDIAYGWGLPDALSALEYSPSNVASGQSSDVTKPGSFALLNPYPNPFNAEIVIPFQLDSPEKVTIAIYDITGRLAATVWSRPASPGRHEVRWNGEGCASGVYLVRAEAGKRVEVGKVIMVK
ncbi:MAG: S8 family serine peptidase [Candidatus Latescibacterota bacterium]